MLYSSDILLSVPRVLDKHDDMLENEDIEIEDIEIEDISENTLSYET